MHIEIIAAGIMRDQHHKGLVDEYLNRMKWKVNIREFSVNISKKHTSDQIKSLEAQEYLKLLKSDHYLILMDERGKDLTSQAFAQKLGDLQNQQQSKIQFLIGGAAGFHADILQRADLKLSFGRQVWPHMFIRFMLSEQLYRAQQILSGHPYHRA